jgi:hypothetical protein
MTEPVGSYAHFGGGEPPRMMRMRFHDQVVPLAALGFLLAVPLAVAGQEAPGPPDGKETHLTVERMQDGFLIAPDVKFTDVNGRFANLVGAYGGWMMEQRLLIGAAGYWQTNSTEGSSLSYGGALVQWVAYRDRRLALSAQALIGGGSATATSTYTGTLPIEHPDQRMEPFRFGPGFHGLFPPNYRPPTGPVELRLESGFFIAEPQVNLSWKATRWLRVVAGGSYRLVAGTNMDSSLGGITGSLSLQLGGGS